MKLLLKSILALSSIFILSSCDKVIDVLKNPEIPKSPALNQPDFIKVGVFSAYAEGTYEEVDEDPGDSDFDPVYASQGSMSIFGIDKDGNSVRMQDQSGNTFDNKTTIYIKTVKSGVIFSIVDANSDGDSLVETYFTGDGKIAKKILESEHLHTGYENQGFFIPKKLDIQYFCSNDKIFKWDDKKQMLEQVFADFLFEDCWVSESNESHFINIHRVNSDTNRREYVLAEIKMNESGEVYLNLLKEFSVSMTSYYYYNKLTKIKDHVFFIENVNDMIGNVVSLRKINLITKEESLIKDFNLDEENNWRIINLLFNGESIDNKIYIEAILEKELDEPEPIQLSDGSGPLLSWNQWYKRIYKLYSLSMEDGSLSEEFKNEGSFVNYRTLRSGDLIYILRSQSYAEPNSNGYSSIEGIKVLDLLGSILKNILPKNNVWNNSVSLGNLSMIVSFDNSVDPGKIKLIIPPAISNGQFLELDSVNDLNPDDISFFSFYDEVIFNFKRKDSNISELGILKRDGRVNIFKQKNTTISGRFIK